MRQKIFWLDLAVCSLWLLIALANCSWRSLPAHFLMVVTIVMRIILSFSLYRREKRSWIPLTVFSALFALLSVEGPVMRTTGDFADLPFVVMGINNDHLTQTIIKCTLLAWLFLGPLVVYIVGLCRKTLTASTLNRKDALGGILWKDKGAKKYCQLMLIAICALYAGLAMDMRMCRFACIVLPALSLYLIARYVNSSSGTLEKNPVVGKLWVMVAAMVLFFYAQRYAGMWRVWMLVVSIAMVAYVCWQTFGKRRMLVLYALSVLYIGIFLPTLAIGNNQYACIEHARWGFGTLESYRGILFVKDTNTDRVGLRDRYGLLVKPEYDNIVYHTPQHLWGSLELRKNGYFSLYDICNNSITQNDGINHQLQDSICMLLERHMISSGYDYNELMEIKVKEGNNLDRLTSHVKVVRNGSTSYYDYHDNTYITEDSILVPSGVFVSDTIDYYGNRLYVLHYSHDVKRDSTVLYNIGLKTARQSTPQHEEFDELSKRIEALLKQ